MALIPFNRDGDFISVSTCPRKCGTKTNKHEAFEIFQIMYAGRRNNTSSFGDLRFEAGFYVVLQPLSNCIDINEAGMLECRDQ